MKEKITNALKTEYAKMGLGDKAFDGVASFLVKTITKEEEIDGVIKSEDTKNLLKAFQGESDSLRNRNAQLEKDFNAYKESHPEKKEEKKDVDTEPEWAKKLREQNEKILEAQEKRDKAEKQKATMTAVLASAKKDGCTDEKALKLTEKLFSLKEGESDDDAAKRFKDEYNANKKEYFGNGVVPGFGMGQSIDTDESAFKASLTAFAESKGLKKQED